MRRNLTLRAALERYNDSHLCLSAGYKELLTRAVDRLGPGRTICMIRPTDITGLMRQRLLRGQSPYTVNCYRRCLLTILSSAGWRGTVPRVLPKEYPPKDTVYYYFKAFRQDGTWERVHDLVRKRVRVKHGKQHQPSAAILDSQSVKTTEKRGYVAATTPARR